MNREIQRLVMTKPADDDPRQLTLHRVAHEVARERTNERDDKELLCDGKAHSSMVNDRRTTLAPS
jgi:hypothetical protein